MDNLCFILLFLANASVFINCDFRLLEILFKKRLSYFTELPLKETKCFKTLLGGFDFIFKIARKQDISGSDCLANISQI